MSPELSKCTTNRVAESRLPCQPIGKDFYPGRANLPLSWGFSAEIVVVVALACCRPKKHSVAAHRREPQRLGVEVKWLSAIRPLPPAQVSATQTYRKLFFSLCFMWAVLSVSSCVFTQQRTGPTVESHCPLPVPLQSVWTCECVSADRVGWSPLLRTQGVLLHGTLLRFCIQTPTCRLLFQLFSLWKDVTIF